MTASVLLILGSLASAFAAWLVWYLTGANERTRLKNLTKMRLLEARLGIAIASRDPERIGEARLRLREFADYMGHPL